MGVGASVSVDLVLKFRIFNKNVSLGSPAGLQLHSVDKVGLKLKSSTCLCPHQGWDQKHDPVVELLVAAFVKRQPCLCGS